MVDLNRVRHGLLSAALTAAFVVMCAPPAGADYEAGKRAWDAGKPAEALAQWQTAADAGDRRAMLALGRLYRTGLGAPQDYVLAHMWFNLAASRGETEAVKERDALAARMTPQQVAAAQERARAWRPGGGGRGKPETASAAGQATGPPPARAIREAQELLAALGYEPGPADGKWGRRSARAYAAFLRDAGLPPGDTLTPVGLRAMRAIAERQGTGTATGSRAGAATRQPAGRTPPPDALHQAVLAGDVDGLRAALNAGVDVNARDRRGWTALMHAANKGYTLIVASLLEAKADTDVRAADGATALFIAVMNGHPEAIALLMRAGASVSVRGPRGLTPADAARLIYGDKEGQRPVPGDAEVRALLGGMTWEDAVKAERERIAREQAEREAREKAEREKAERERELWASVKESGDPSDLEKYLEAYPGGAYEDVARRRLNKLLAEDDAAYAKAKAAGTEAAYEAYLSAYPSGRHMAEARETLERAALRRPGRVFRDCAECPQMVVVPAGSFMMGSPSHEEDRDDDEGPLRRVSIVEPFAVGIYEVTFAEWDACVAAGGCNGSRPEDRDWGRGRRPVINVSWNDARAYVGWLSRTTGERYRLLSEAEWEYAARAGTTGPFHFGSAISADQANFLGGFWGFAHFKTVPVGSFPANGFGLHDVHGNVWEWVEDCWHSSYAGAPSDGSAWTRGGDCRYRVNRGGSWNGSSSDLRSANRDGYRDGYTTGSRNLTFGFRVARTLD